MCSLSHPELIGTTAKMDGVWTKNGHHYWRISKCFGQEANFITARTSQVTNLNFGLLSFFLFFFFTLFNVFNTQFFVPLTILNDS